ncbi:MAG: lipopolysaccharide biosynthesis protein [Eubacterium sp.]|nr:lipopolysaccharide biosynthesis protein [Eubacterium sp.]
MKNKEETSILKNYTLVSIICAGLSFFTMLVLTRMLSEEDYGKINLFYSASNVVMSIACFGLDSAYIRFYYEPPNGSSSKTLAFHCIVPSVLLLSVFSFILLSINKIQMISGLIGGNGITYVIAFIFVVWGMFIVRYLTVFFRMNGKVIIFAIVSIFLVVLTKSIVIVLHFIFHNLYIDIIFSAFIFALFSLVIVFRYFYKIIEIKRICFRNYSEVYKYALLASPIFVITYLNGYLPQIIISNKLGEDILGVYTAALLFCSAIQVLSTGFTTFWSPYMFKHYKDRIEIIKKVHDMAFAVAFFVLSFLLVFCDFIYLFIGERFRKYQELIGFFLFFPIVNILVETTSYGISIKKKNEISLVIYLIVMLLNVSLSLILVDRLFLFGVAISSFVSSGLFFVLMTHYGQRFYKSVNDLKKSYVNIFLLCLIPIVFYFFYSNRIYFIISDLIIVLLFIIFNYRSFHMMIKYIKLRNQ